MCKCFRAAALEQGRNTNSLLGSDRFSGFILAVCISTGLIWDYCNVFLWIKGTGLSLVLSQSFLSIRGTGLHWYYYHVCMEAFCYVRVEVFFAACDHLGGSYICYSPAGRSVLGKTVF